MVLPPVAAQGQALLRRSACGELSGELSGEWGPDVRSKSFYLGGGFEVDVGEFAIGQPFAKFCDQADGF